MRLRQFTFLTALLLIVNMLAFSQGGNQINSNNDKVDENNFSQLPVIGERCPDFLLKDVQHSETARISLDDLKGQNVILDFFSTGCVVCVKSFPKTNALQQKYLGKVKIILVGKDDKYIRDMYEKYRSKYQLNFPIAYDSALCTKWQFLAFPKVVWIDKDGIVKAVSGSQDVTDENILSFIEGKPFIFSDYSAKAYAAMDKSLEIARSTTNGENSNDYLYYSRLSKWDGIGRSYPPVQLGTDVKNNQARVVAIGIPLGKLYTFSLLGSYFWSFGDSIYGKSSMEPILEIKNKKEFEFSFRKDELSGLYNILLYCPQKDGTFEHMSKVMQNELFNAFGYDATIEERLFPCWKLVKISDKVNKLRSKGTLFSYSGTHAGFVITNISVSNLLGRIAGYHFEEGPFLDETGVDFNIDINFDGIITDLDEVKKVLNENGLDLIKDKVMMKAVVIRDNK